MPFSLIHVSVALVFVLFTTSITVQHVQVVDLTSENCNTDILSTSLNKDVQLILTRNESGNVSGIDGCYYIVNLDYGTFMRSKTEVTVSVKSMLDCGYKVEIYPGEPLINKNIETLDCDSNPTWTGHFPTTTIFLRYVMKTKKDINYISTRFDNMMTNIIYRSCSSCYQTPTIYGIPKERLTGYCGREVCVGDRDVEYSYMYPSYWNNFGWCPPCRSIAFYVNDSAQICFESYQYMYVWGRELCHVTVEINNNSVLVLKNSLREKWCLPWSLKHKRIEFTFGDDFNLKCYSTTRCIANIRIIPDNKDSQLCPIQTPKEWRTRTGYSSLYAESGDEYNDSKNMTAIIYLIISSVLVMVCGCFCKYTYKRKSKESKPRPVEGMNGMQNTIHQRTEDQPTASESSDEDLGYSENMRGSIINVRNVPEIGPMSAHGTTFAYDNSETINDEQLQDATQNYSHLHLHQLSSWSENIEYHDTDQPPSYEEVSRCDQPR